MLQTTISREIRIIVDQLRKVVAMDRGRPELGIAFEHAADANFVIDPSCDRIVDANFAAAKRLG